MDRLDAEIGAPDGVAAAPPAEAPPRFGASHALMTFGLVLFGQTAVGIGLVVGTTIVAVVRGADGAGTADAIGRMTVPALYSAAAVTVLVVVLALRVWAWHLVRDRSPSGLGFVLPPLRQLLVWSALGLLLATGYLALTRVVPTDFEGGPLAKVAAAGGSGRVTWTILALLFAPVTEELLFRGLMLRGLMASWGVVAAGTIVTILFFAMHLFEAFGYWPAMVSILTMGLVTLFARLRTGSLITSMAVHGAYNLVIVIAVHAFMPSP